MNRVAKLLKDKIEFPRWRWTSVAVFVAIGLLARSYRAWQDGDQFTFWITFGMNALCVVIGLMIWREAVGPSKGGAGASPPTPVSASEENE